MQKVILNISDMNCASCTKTIEDYLKKQEGIIKAEVNFSTESATIKYDENILNESKIINLISLAGYTAAKEDINHCDQIKKIHTSTMGQLNTAYSIKIWRSKNVVRNNNRSS